MHYDPRWLAVTRAFQPFFPSSRHPASNPPLPADPKVVEEMVGKDLRWVRENVPEQGEGAIGEVEPTEEGGKAGVGFVKTAIPIGGEGGDSTAQRAYSSQSAKSGM